LLAVAGQRYVIEANTNLANTNWAATLTNVPATTNASLILPGNSAQRFFRARWQP